ncbi:hypothetical protein B0H19DRAFT_935829 [Mycena capillaripes]|nr:hypothetical protein B0H19DRAFT_935829 [Mycena capillaripes]
MSPTCSICLESFTSPVSLPCGHVFCRECIRRTVQSVKSCSIQHCCPACRAPYSILTIDPALIPPYLRPHILPPIRKVFFDDPTPGASTSTASPSTSASTSTSATSPPPALAADLARATAELTALQQQCATWRRRAEVHAAANSSLLGFARAAKDCALRLRTERDAERSRCVLLKRKLAELMCVPVHSLLVPPMLMLCAGRTSTPKMSRYSRTGDTSCPRPQHRLARACRFSSCNAGRRSTSTTTPRIWRAAILGRR